MNSNLTKEELNIVREISIKKICGIENKRGKVNVRCVFHQDKTPSLLIDDNNGYYCFGCGKKGKGALSFVMDMGIRFDDALKELSNYL